MTDAHALTAPGGGATVRRMRAARLLLALGTVALVLACDRKVEPFVPGEKPEAPNLVKIFPPGAEQAQPMTAPGEPPPPPPAAPPSDEAAVAPSGAPIRGVVRLAPELLDRAPANATLFVIARGGAGGPPVAVKRIPAASLPYAFELGPDDRMIQTIPFAGPLQLSARLDADGNATTRAAGDVQGAAAAPVEPGATGVELVLDEPL